VKELGDFRDKVVTWLHDNFSQIFRENRENETRFQEAIEKFLQHTERTIETSLVRLSDTMWKEFTKLNTSTWAHLESISQKVDTRLESGFKQTNETFQKLLERMARIDEAQKNIENLNKDVVSLQWLFTAHKSRGIAGEVHLENILTHVFGEKTDLFEMQYHFSSNGKTVDAVLKTSQWLIPIDAKFPFTRTDAAGGFVIQKKDIKKHIDDISSKYTHADTIWYALMFVPAEAIFSEIHSAHVELIDYAHTKKVTLVSSTTLLAMLHVILVAVHSLETSKQATVIQEELWKLSVEFDRFWARWGNFSKHYAQVTKDMEQIDITSKKITGQFDRIGRLELE